MPPDAMTVKLGETLTACPVCGGKKLYQLISAQVLSYSEILTYSSCMGCGLMFLNPRMTDKQTTDYYQGDYRTRIFGEKGQTETDQLVQRLRASLHAQVLTAWGVVPRSALDIGCGAGFSLWEWHKRGATVAGVEPDERCRGFEPARRYNVVSDLAELASPPFDLIIMSHSLEHMNHPKAFLQNVIANHAHSSTYLMIEVPNTECSTAAYRIHHPIAFTGYTLNNLMASLGYQPVHIFYHGLGTTQIQPYLMGLYQPGEPQQDRRSIA